MAGIPIPTRNPNLGLEVRYWNEAQLAITVLSSLTTNNISTKLKNSLDNEIHIIISHTIMLCHTMLKAKSGNAATKNSITLFLQNVWITCVVFFYGG